MSNSFRQAYESLTRFVLDHPEIEIRESVTSIPGKVRVEFYNLFNAARDAFVEERFPAYLNEAGLLWDQYQKAEERNASLFALEDISVATETQRFVRDPQGTLTRELFDPLFDLLKGRESIDSFEKKAASKIKEIFPAVYRGAYAKWARLALVELLEADKTLGVATRTLGPGEQAKPAWSAKMEEVPFPTESTRFFFSQPRNLIFAVPDLIVHSSKLNRFVGIRTEFSEGLYNAWYPSSNREWHSITTDLLILLDYGLTLIYAAEEAADIALVADASRLCLPDLVLWCIDSRSQSKKEALEMMVRADSIFRPIKGSYIVANNPWTEPVEQTGSEQEDQAVERASGVHLLFAGYDPSRLMPVVEAIAKQPDAPLTV
jgi:hypothetical protein